MQHSYFCWLKLLDVRLISNSVL